MSHTVCVYCGSRIGTDPADEQAAYDLGQALANHQFSLVYGGGSVGLMGILARSMLHHGGRVIGIIPHALKEREIGLEDAHELIVTQTMRERKGLMDKRSDAFMVLPGGFGTLEEMMETLTLRQLGYHNKPVVIVNLHGYYDPLIDFFQHTVTQGYMPSDHVTLFQVATSVEEAVALLSQELTAQQTNHHTVPPQAVPPHP